MAGGLPSDRSLNGLFAFDQAKAIAAQGVEVFFFAIDIRSIRRRRHWGVSEGIRDGVHWFMYSLPVGRVPFAVRFYVGRYMLKRLFYRVFEEIKWPDIIHAHFVSIGIMSSYLSKKTGLPLVITEHSSVMNVSPIPQNIKKYAKESYTQAKRVLAVSSCLSANILNECGIESEVVPNIIDLSIFNQCVPVEHDGFNVVTTCGLVKGKGVFDLVKAVQKASHFIPQLHLDIIGDGELRNDLEKYVDENNISDRIKFWGFLPREKTVKVYENADCFSMLSERETFGVVYVEALAAGLPIIATKCGGPEDFVDDEVGILVGVNNIDEASDAIINLYNGYSRYKKDVLRNRASEYNPQTIASKLINIYETI